MAGRFPLLTDACVNDHLVQALSALGWNVVRAIDLYPERTNDEVLFARAATEGRVFVTNDRPAEAIAIRWLEEGRRFRGVVAWPGHPVTLPADGAGQTYRLRLGPRACRSKRARRAERAPRAGPRDGR